MKVSPLVLLAVALLLGGILVEMVLADDGGQLSQRRGFLHDWMDSLCGMRVRWRYDDRPAAQYWPADHPGSN